ncbi:MAG: hypothetical protein HYV28_08505 [Ignavibacteriales bacterium]|nr:hypothetical protein [Ignavibacteriales bacterium]
MPTEAEKLELLKTIIESPEFKDSNRLKEILTYLVHESIKGNKPKEISIALDVLGKGKDFDSKSDSIVRVYVNNLRNKLDTYYKTVPPQAVHYRIIIPKGSYELDFIAIEEQKKAKVTVREVAITAVIVILISVIVFMKLVNTGNESSALVNHPLLKDFITAKNKPTLVVLGDFFFMNDLEKGLTFHNNVRNFKINNIDDFLKVAKSDDTFNKRFSPARYTYLRPSATLGLIKLLPYLNVSEKAYEIKLASQLTAEDFKSFNVIFIGQAKSLFIIQLFIENYGIKFDLNTSSISLKTRETDSMQTYTSSQIMGGKYENDFSMIIRGTTSQGADFLFLMGFSEIGVLGAVNAITDPKTIGVMQIELNRIHNHKKNNFSVIFETEGMNQTIFKSSFKHLFPLLP